MDNHESLTDDEKEAIQIANRLLIPCPFCGATPKICVSIGHTTLYGIYHHCGEDKKIGIELKWEKIVGRVVTNWNTRAVLEDDI